MSVLSIGSVVIAKESRQRNCLQEVGNQASPIFSETFQQNLSRRRNQQDVERRTDDETHKVKEEQHEDDDDEEDE